MEVVTETNRNQGNSPFCNNRFGGEHREQLEVEASEAELCVLLPKESELKEESI